MKWLNYHHLFYFKIIAQEGSIAKASKILSVGQPALSTQLKQLEDNLGVKLFIRKNKSLVLTQEGQVGLKYASEIFKMGDEFLQVFNDKSLGIKTHYSIGAIDIMPKTVICELIENAKDFGNNCSVTILEESLSVLIGKLISYELDIILTNSNLSLNYDVKSMNIGDYKIGAYASVQYKNLKKNFPKSLNGKPVVLPTSHSKFRYDIDRFYKDNGMKYDLVAECQDSAVKKMLAVNGKGIVFLPINLKDYLKESYNLIELGVIDELNETFWLNYPKGIFTNQVTEQLLEHYKS